MITGLKPLLHSIQIQNLPHVWSLLWQIECKVITITLRSLAELTIFSVILCLSLSSIICSCQIGKLTIFPLFCVYLCPQLFVVVKLGIESQIVNI